MHEYVIYARKSTESDDRQAASIPAQVEELRTLAARRGLQVARVVEESKSAKAPGRPAFGELLDAVQAGGVHSILCWKLDRLARNPVDGGAIIWTLAKRQLSEIITPGRVYTGSGDDKFMMTLEFGMANKYIDDLSDNVKRGIRARVARGWSPARPPQGYLADRNTGTVVPDPERFPLLRHAADLILHGTRPSEALRILNTAFGYRTPWTRAGGGKPLAVGPFYRLLANPFFCGLIPFHGELLPGKHEPLMTPQEFRQIQVTLHREGRERPSRHEWAFSGLIRCGECTAMVTASWQRSHTGRLYPYYHCTRHKNRSCRQPYLPAQELERQLAEWLGRVSLDRRIVEVYLTALDELRVDRHSFAQAARQRSERERRSLRQQLDNLVQLRIQGRIGDEEYDANQKRLTLLLEDLGSEHVPVDPIEPTRAVILVLSEAKNQFLVGDDATKRTLVTTLGSNPTLRDRFLHIETQKPFSILGEGHLIPTNCG